MSSSTVKENANPTIHAVRRRKTSRLSQETSVGHAELQKYSRKAVTASTSSAWFVSNDESDWSSSLQSTVERSVLIALQDIAIHSHIGDSATVSQKSSTKQKQKSEPENLQILKIAGFFVDPTANLNFTKPLFIPYKYAIPQSTIKKSKENQRDPFDDGEIFDMIRTINDPEHPLSLEQLNVVNLEDIKVFDALSDNDLMKSEGTLLSAVEIMFT